MANLVTDIDEVARLAAEKEDENWAFRAWLKGHYGYDDERLMRVVRKLADDVSSRIDCTQCANCCLKLATYLDDEDVTRLARALHLTVSDLQAAYLQVDQERKADGRHLPAPCPLLEGTLCSVYAARPAECRAYPHLEADFVSHSIGRIEATFVCPIVYHVVEGMKEALRWRR